MADIYRLNEEVGKYEKWVDIGTDPITGNTVYARAVAADIVVGDTIAVTGPLTNTEIRATALPVSGPLTDTQIRATALPVSGPLTDTQIRATALPVSGPLTDTQIRATALPVSGPLTDTQIRATALPVSGPLTDTQIRATALPVGVSTVTLPTTLLNGVITVTTATTRVPLIGASTPLVSGVTVKAAADNTGIIYVGNSAVAAANGFRLAAGESQFIEIANLASVYVDASVDAQSVTYIAS